MEVSDNVVLNRRMLPVNMFSTDNLVRNAVRRYDDAPYIPDNAFVVLRCPLDGKIPGSDYFDTATCPPVHIRYSNNAKNLKRQRARSSPINIRRSLQRYTSGAGFPPERPASLRPGRRIGRCHRFQHQPKSPVELLLLYLLAYLFPCDTYSGDGRLFVLPLPAGRPFALASQGIDRTADVGAAA